jgi:hypothetical protein
MARQRHNSESADPPLTLEQEVIADDLLWKAIEVSTYKRIMGLLENIIVDPRTELKIWEERQRRQAESNDSLAAACAAFLKEIEGVDLAPIEVIVIWFKKVFYLRPSEIERVLPVSNASQMLSRIGVKITTQQRQNA